MRKLKANDEYGAYYTIRITHCVMHCNECMAPRSADLRV